MRLILLIGVGATATAITALAGLLATALIFAVGTVVGTLHLWRRG